MFVFVVLVNLWFWVDIVYLREGWEKVGEFGFLLVSYWINFRIFG